MNPPVFRLRILLREGLIAVLTGLLAFGISLLLTPGPPPHPPPFAKLPPPPRAPRAAPATTH